MLNTFAEHEHVRLTWDRRRLAHHFIHQAVNEVQPGPARGTRLDCRLRRAMRPTRGLSTCPLPPTAMVLASAKGVNHRMAAREAATATENVAQGGLVG